MKKLLSMLVAVTLLAGISIMPVAVSAADLIWNDYEAYTIGDDTYATVFTAGLLVTGPWEVDASQKSTNTTKGSLAIVEAGAEGQPSLPGDKTASKLLRMGNASSNRNPFLGKASGFDFSGERKTSFWANFKNLNDVTFFQLRPAYGTGTGSKNFNIFNHAKDAETINVCAVEVPNFTLEAGEWNYYEIYTNAFVDGSTAKITYTVYINGDNYVYNDTVTVGTGLSADDQSTAFTNAGCRLSVAAPGTNECFVYWDDFLVTDDFESPEPPDQPDTAAFSDSFNYDIGTLTSSATGGKWSSVYPKTSSGGAIDAVLSDIYGAKSAALRMGGNVSTASDLDPYMDTASLNFEGRHILSFDANFGDQGRPLTVQWRSAGGNAGTIFSRAYASDTVSVFGTVVPEFTVEPDTWNHYAIDIDLYNDDGIIKADYSVYIDGVQYVAAATWEGTGNSALEVSTRVTSNGRVQGYVLLDNLLVTSYKDMPCVLSVSPAGSNVPVYQRNAEIILSADIDKAALTPADVAAAVTASSVPVAAKDVQINGNKILINLAGENENLSFGETYSVSLTLPSGTADVFGTRELGAATPVSLSFTTESGKDLGDYVMSGFRIEGAYGEKITAPQAGVVKVSGEIAKKNANASDLTFIIAWYDGDKALKDVAFEKAEAAEGENTTLSAGITIPDGDFAGHTLKAFAWDNLNNMVPFDIIEP